MKLPAVWPLLSRLTRTRRRIAGAGLMAFLVFGLPAWAAAPSLPPLVGWRQSTAALNPTAVLSPAANSVLREFGLQAMEQATYRRRGNRFQLTGYRFADPGGAFGAFTYLRAPADHAVKLDGITGLAIEHDHGLLLLRGPWLLELQPAPPGVTAAALRMVALRLATEMKAKPGASGLPAVLFDLPRPHARPGSVKYAEGPEAFSAACAWAPAQGLGFHQDAEAAIASYDFAGGGEAQLVLLSYPTPQIAGHYEQSLASPATASRFLIRRYGSLLALVHGSDDAAAAQLAGLLQAVHPHAQVVMTPPVPLGLNALPALIFGIFLLCLYLMLAALVTGLVVGSAWVWWKKKLPEEGQAARRKAMTGLGLTGGAIPDANLSNGKQRV